MVDLEPSVAGRSQGVAAAVKKVAPAGRIALSVTDRTRVGGSVDGSGVPARAPRCEPLRPI